MADAHLRALLNSPSPRPVSGAQYKVSELVKFRSRFIQLNPFYSQMGHPPQSSMVPQSPMHTPASLLTGPDDAVNAIKVWYVSINSARCYPMLLTHILPSLQELRGLRQFGLRTGPAKDLLPDPQLRVQPTTISRPSDENQRPPLHCPDLQDGKDRVYRSTE